MARWMLSVFSLVVPMLLVSVPAGAQERKEEASVWFQRGAREFQHGNARDAAEAFEEAGRLAPHGAASYNAALAWEAAGEPARAAQAFSDALERGGITDKQTDDARTRLENLTSKLGRLHVSAPPGSKISLEHIQDASPPLDIYVVPGVHQVEVLFDDGEKVFRKVRVSKRGKRIEIRHPGDGEPDGVGRGDATADSGGSSDQTLGWLAVGGAGAFSGAAIYLGLQALDARDTFNESGHTDGDARDRAASRRTWANVAWALAAASGATGVVLLVGGDDADHDADHDADDDAAVAVRVGPLGASLSGRW